MIIQGNNSELILPRGDSFRIALELTYQTLPVSLEDETGFFAVFDGAGQIQSARLPMGIAEDGLFATNYIDGSFSANLPTQGLMWELRLNTDGGGDRISGGVFRVVAASPQPPVGDVPVGSTVVSVTRPTTRLRFAMQGRPGKSPWAAAGQTLDQYNEAQAQLAAEKVLVDNFPFVLTVPVGWPYAPPGTLLTVPEGYTV